MQLLQSDVAGAIVAGFHGRPAEELLTALRKGSHLLKHGRRGHPKQHYFRLSHDDRDLLWDSSNGKVRSVRLASVAAVQQGQLTDVFRRSPMPDLEQQSFSLIYPGAKPGQQRSLDVVCKTQAEFQTWYWGIQLVIAVTQQDQQQQPALVTSSTGGSQSDSCSRHTSAMASPRMSDDKLADLRQIAAALQPVKALLGGVTQRSLPAAAGAAGAGAAPPGKRAMGDCYICGSWGDCEAVSAATIHGRLQSSPVPVMVSSTHALDIRLAAVGARHAALLTRGGEVYSWGGGAGATLGNGFSGASSCPQQVTRLAGRGTVAVACAHSYSAAVLRDGSLHCWGSGLGGQLGLGPVAQVACGPFHAAAITDAGRLFTWGDGLFGKLGHGDHASSYSPRAVEALAEHWVLSVSCGWWHSAAAALPRAGVAGGGGGGSPRRSTASSCGSDAGSSDAGGRPSASFSSMLPQPAGGGGSMFTWGGDFTWQQRGKRDHHEGCLGLGDLAGRLVPSLVKGEDDIQAVACGLNFTLALTSNGEVLQMGRTGAENVREHNAMWEGARVPVLVGGLLASHTAESLAVGTSHAAVVARQRGVRAGGGRGATRLLAWGKGARGQLGLGDCEDHLLPQVVSAVAGRRILHLSAGGNFTLVVCEHDPAAARCTREHQQPDSGSPLPPAAAAGGGPLSSAATRYHLLQGQAAARGQGQQSAGSGGLAVSSSLTSLASSRGDEPAAAGPALSTTSLALARRSDWDRSEGAAGDRAGGGPPGLPVARSLDRSIGGLAGLSSRGVSFAFRATGGGRGGEQQGACLDPHMLSLQHLAAAASKRSRLAAGMSQVKAQQARSTPRADSFNSSSSSRQWLADRLDSVRGLERAVAAAAGGGNGALSARSSLRQLSYTARSEPDLATVSVGSSGTASGAASMTPSASVSSLAVLDAGDQGSPAASADLGLQLRYWQQRAANMELLLARKTQELELSQQQQRQQQQRAGAATSGAAGKQQLHEGCLASPSRLQKQLPGAADGAWDAPVASPTAVVAAAAAAAALTHPVAVQQQQQQPAATCLLSADGSRFTILETSRSSECQDNGSLPPQQDAFTDTRQEHEYAPGVLLLLQLLPGSAGRAELKRVRFSQQMFSTAEAELWWAANREAVHSWLEGHNGP